MIDGILEDNSLDHFHDAIRGRINHREAGDTLSVSSRIRCGDCEFAGVTFNGCRKYLN